MALHEGLNKCCLEAYLQACLGQLLESQFTRSPCQWNPPCLMRAALDVLIFQQCHDQVLSGFDLWSIAPMFAHPWTSQRAFLDGSSHFFDTNSSTSPILSPTPCYLRSSAGATYYICGGLQGLTLVGYLKPTERSLDPQSNANLASYSCSKELAF